MTTPHPSETHRAWRWIHFSGKVVLLAVVMLQWRAISHLRQELQTLRAPAKAASSKPDQAPPALASAANVDPEAWKQLRKEIRQLRDEIQRLKQPPSPAKAAGPVSPSPGPLATAREPSATPNVEDARSLVAAAMRGDTAALDTLATKVAASLGKSPETVEEALSEIRAAFDHLGTEAGNGDESALQTIWRASRIQELEGFATAALGQAAALGQEEALRPLLEPEAFFLLRSSATSALKPAADAGNERAIQALAATAADPAHQPLWLLVAQGLQGAASAGNATAIETLARIAAQASAAIQKEAVLALEAAARKNQPQAEEALRRLGWR